VAGGVSRAEITCRLPAVFREEQSSKSVLHYMLLIAHIRNVESCILPGKSGSMCEIVDSIGMIKQSIKKLLRSALDFGHP